MTNWRDRTQGTRWLWPTAILLAVAVAVLVRLADPLSTPVIPAEDPYNHMALVQEHLRDGALDPLHEDGSMYPPGMHALLAAGWVFTGIDLYTIFRFAPVFFGAVGVLGVALLLARFEGKAAGVFGAFAFALAPEIAFRTTMMAPTAVDLAVLPFLLYALLNVVEGNLWWTAAAVPMSVFLLVAHPWVFAVVTLAAVAFLALAYLIPWSPERGPRPQPKGIAAGVATMTGALGLAVLGCWGTCGPGFGFVVRDLALPLPLTAIGYLLLAGAVLVGWLLAAAPDSLDASIPDVPDWTIPRGALSIVLLAALAAGTYPAVQQGMPPHVDLGSMFGWPILVAAAAGAVALPFLSSPAAILGASIALTTYPFVIYDPFNSPFWSHRTAVYLGIGLVLLGAVFIARSARAVTRKAVPSDPRPQAVSRSLVVVTPLLLVAASVGGVWAATPDAVDNRWYRLYDECEMDGLEGIADHAADDDSTLVIAGDWRPKLVLAALTPNASRVWFMAELYTMPDGERQDFLRWATEGDRSVVAVVDRHLVDNHPDASTEFLHEGNWTQAQTQTCNDASDPPREIQAFELQTVRS